ncbi:MAG TPA: hypothetical protein VF932_11435 [Anaerolineae bacterium]
MYSEDHREFSSRLLVGFKGAKVGKFDRLHASANRQKLPCFATPRADAASSRLVVFGGDELDDGRIRLGDQVPFVAGRDVGIKRDVQDLVARGIDGLAVVAGSQVDGVWLGSRTRGKEKEDEREDNKMFL